MSGGLLQYSGLVTKTKAMRGRLLSRELLLRLAEYGSVEEFISFLWECDGYASIYQSHKEIAHRAEVEAVINDSLYADYDRLYRFAGEEQRKALEIQFFRYEVNVLKEHLERVFREENAGQSEHQHIWLSRHTGYDMNALRTAGSIEDILQTVAGTRYEKPVRRIAEQGEQDSFHIAMQLDIYYYVTAWKMCSRFSDEKQSRIMKAFLGTEIDWQNIMWMYRFKCYFDQKISDIYANLIPVCWRLKKSEFRRLLETGSLAEFVEILGKTAYFTDKDAVVKMGDEITYRRVMEKTYRQMCRKYPMSIAPVLHYLYEKEQEIETLTTILEGVRYQIPAREIQELVIETK